MIARARHVTRRWHNSYEQDWNDPLTRPDHTKADEQATRIHDHLKVCSCSGCGNPRRGGWDEPRTRQELRAELDLQDQLEEI